VEPQVVAQALHVPAAPLADHIETLWYHEIRGYSGRELILPSPYIELILNFGNPHKVLDLADFARFDWQRDGWLAGMQTRVLAIESTSSHMIGARFKPGGAHAFMPRSPADFADQVAPVERIFGEEILQLRRRLLAAAAPEEKFKLFEEFLAARFAPDEDAYRLVRAAVAELEASRGTRPLAEVSEQLGVSHKHLTQLFTRLVGVRPKQFARMLRFNSVVAALDISQDVDWIAVAHAADFYDQSHFINEFRAFTGLTPVDYLTRWRALQAKPVEYDPRFLPLG
jgi:AraC-like DNA-binding protein